MQKRERRYWLMKSEPSTFSFDDLLAAPGQTTGWDGVRNFQVRNFMRDLMAIGDGVLFYHSSSQPSGVVGLAEIARAAYPDPTQFERGHAHFDPKSDPGAPTWLQVEVKALGKLRRVVTLAELQANRRLATMGVVQRGNRLSVQPVTRAQWEEVLRMAGRAGGS